MRPPRPDGAVISARPSQVQDADVPAEIRDPVDTDQRVRRLSISGVAVGTILDYSVTYEDVKPFPTGDAYGSWSVSMGAPVRRSRLVLDVPAAVTPTIVEHNLRFARAERTAGGRRVHTWATSEVPRITPEPYAAADRNDVYQHLAYALPRTWQQVGAWYAGLTRDRYALGPAAYTPWGELPYGPQGEFALVVRADGRVDEVTIPREPVAANRSWMRLTGTLAPDGTFAGRCREGAAGLQQYQLRTAFETPLDSTRRADVTRTLAAKVYPGATGDS